MPNSAVTNSSIAESSLKWMPSSVNGSLSPKPNSSIGAMRLPCAAEDLGLVEHDELRHARERHRGQREVEPL